MSVEEAVYEVLSDDAPVAAIVGTRIYPVRAPKSQTLPLLLYQRISAPRQEDHDGSDAVFTRMQVRVHGSSYREVNSLTAKVRDALHDLSATVSGLAIQSRLVNELDGGFVDDDHTYARVLDFIIHHNE